MTVMEPIFEAKYINIKWMDKFTASKITESINTIPISVTGNYTNQIHAVTYSKINEKIPGQLAFHFFNTTAQVIPTFEINSLEQKELIPVKDNLTGKIWWIENGKWDKEHKRRDSPICRHAGEVRLNFGNTTCIILIHTSSFKYEDLGLYLENFQNDFWYLILKENNYIKGTTNKVDKSQKILDSSSVDIISKFIEFTTKVIDNPKKELREIQSLKDIKKVRPVPRTFMEIATKGYQKLHTSRDYKDSYNVAENKYIFYILNRIYILLKRMTIVTEKISQNQNKKIEDYKKRLTSFSNVKKIDKAPVENEIEDLKVILAKEHSLLNTAIDKHKQIYDEKQILFNTIVSEEFNSENYSEETLIVKLFSKNQMTYGGRAKKDINGKWAELKNDDAYRVVFEESLSDILEENHIYEITGNITKNINYIVGNIEIHEINFKHVSKINVIPFIQNIKFETVIIKFESKKKYNGVIQFTGKVKNHKGEWNQPNNNDFYSFEFDEDSFDKVLKTNSVYKITAHITKNDKPWSNENKSGIIHKQEFVYVHNIDLIHSSTEETLNSHMKQRLELENSNWERPFTAYELKELAHEKQAIDKSIELSTKQQKLYASLTTDFEPLLSKIQKIVKRFKKLRIEQNSYFPNSMTFVQNPNYQGSNKTYKEILNLSGLDESLFIGLQEVEKIGIIDIPLIYERWTLLQIIKVLIDKFKFIPEENWKHRLMEQFLTTGKNTKIDFFNEYTKRKISFWYEKEVKTYKDKPKKQPDFILDVASTFNGKDSVHRLVMDTKFYENINEKHLGGICSVINELYSKDENNYKTYKNYAEDGNNSVFIIHPSVDAIRKRKTPSDWGKYSYYGENNQCAWDQNEDGEINIPDHKYGAILLSPVMNNGMFLDDLQRLIGMFIQYSIEDNKDIVKNGKIDPLVKEKLFCLVCGSNEGKGRRIANKRKTGFRYEMTCAECNHITKYNYCWNCKNRLIKNGEYWSYHSTQALQPFNIKCPCCGEIL